MGAILARSLVGVALPNGAQGMSASSMLALAPEARAPFAAALHRVFVAGAIVTAVGFVATLFLPPVDFTRHVPAGAGERLLEAEMCSLRPEDEPVSFTE